MAAPRTPSRSIVGKRLGLGAYGNLTGPGSVDLTARAADAAIAVGAEVGNARAISVQLKDANGRNIDYVEEVDLVLFLDAARVAYVVTGGSTGIAIGANGALSTITAKKRFKAVTDAAGLLTLTWTDTGTEAAYLGVRLPTGRWVMSAALTNA